MKNLLIIVLLIGFNITCTQAQTGSKELEGTIKVEVDGLACPFCAYGLEKNLKKIESVEKIEINVKEAFIILTIKKGEAIKEDLIREEVKDAGFTAKQITKSDEK